ncbi:hypothetical protein LTR08_002065 [Meristemomyces frigidus]|nr:hypothetical protein LTR08_002065 [Meristemomyces frigidus]
MSKVPRAQKRRASLGQYQGKLSLPTGDEAPRTKIRWSARRPEDGDVWYKWPPGRKDRLICRELVDDEDELDLDSVHDVAKIMSHTNLVNLVEYSGFGEGYRKETAWEFCGAGTLNSLLLANGKPLPESLIWHTLCSLLKAVHFLNTGRRDEELGRDAATGWKPIVHNSINPANVFYSDPKFPEPGYRMATYGIAKLGNFTRAMVIDAADDDVSLTALYSKGIEGEFTGFESPELSSHMGEPDWTVDEITGEKRGVWGKTIGSASDVWSIGAVAVAMMTGDTIWPLVMNASISVGMMSRRDEDWRTVWPPDRFERLKALTGGEQCSLLAEILPFTYSERLKHFVATLLSPDPWTRVDVVQKLRSAVRLRYDTMSDLEAAGSDCRKEYTEEGEPDLVEEEDL